MPPSTTARTASKPANVASNWNKCGGNAPTLTATITIMTMTTTTTSTKIQRPALNVKCGPSIVGNLLACKKSFRKRAIKLGAESTASATPSADPNTSHDGRD